MRRLIIFPHQLFNPQLIKDNQVDQVIILEHPYFYTRLNFHKQKIILHFTSIRDFSDELHENNIEHKIIKLDRAGEWKPTKKDDWLVFDPVEKDLQKIIKNWQKTYSIDVLDSPNFIRTSQELKEYFNEHRWFMAKFYEYQRKDLNILVKNNKPIGGKWSYDKENRQKLPLKTLIPPRYQPEKSPYLEDALSFIQKNFPQNPGDIEDFSWPTSRQEAEKSLHHFFRHKLAHFGKYQDSIEEEKPFLFHSLISSSLNIGLLQPLEIIESAIEFSKKHTIPINSLEGFIRQIIGWREYIRAIYLLQGNKILKSNFWQFKYRQIPTCFYTAETNLPPVDNCILKTNKFSYAHHIERLMILGNIMLLTGQHPKAVNRWFSEMYIDAYDWVMIPNVLSMSQFADGGLVTTKPYISGSNYIRKMSRYKKDDWSGIWDALYWSFVYRHRKILAKNQRFDLIISILNNFSKEEIAHFKKTAKDFINTL